MNYLRSGITSLSVSAIFITIFSSINMTYLPLKWVVLIFFLSFMQGNTAAYFKVIFERYLLFRIGLNSITSYIIVLIVSMIDNKNLSLVQLSCYWFISYSAATSYLYIVNQIKIKKINKKLEIKRQGK